MSRTTLARPLPDRSTAWLDLPARSPHGHVGGDDRPHIRALGSRLGGRDPREARAKGGRESTGRGTSSLTLMSSRSVVYLARRQVLSARTREVPRRRSRSVLEGGVSWQGLGQAELRQKHSVRWTHRSIVRTF
jgi:hypothetical protein